MSKSKKIFLGILTIWPVIYIFLFFGFFFLTMIGGGDSEIMFRFMFTMHLLTMLLMVALLIIYIRDVLKNKMVPETRKTIWVILLLFGNIIAMPFYWYEYIWKNHLNHKQ